jgi:predicted PurR-regulated permease PerM
MVILLIGGCLYLVGVILFSSVRTILSLYPKYEGRFTEIYSWIATLFQLPYDEHLSFVDNIWGQLSIRTQIRTWTIVVSNAFFTFLKDIVMVLLFVVFLLLESAHLKEKAEMAFEDRISGRIKQVTEEVVLQVSRYLTIKFLISFATGVSVTIGLSIIGIDFPILWGVISFILNFIPNIGSIAAGVGVSLFSLVQFWPHPGPIIAAMAVMLLVNMVLGNILEPKIVGDNLDLSPFVILVSLLAWGWLWGFAGLILAVPMTVIVKILCEHIPVLEPASIILGSYKAAMRRKAQDAEAALSSESGLHGAKVKDDDQNIRE